MKNVLIVDGNSILNRAFYGIRPLTTKDGLFTNAVYGFVNILSKQMEEVSASHLVCAFDLHGPTFRHKAYEGYKANRHGMPEELAVQLPYAKELAAAMGFHVLTLEGYEADDIIGTVSAFADTEEDVMAYVLTGDRDSLQLISDRVNVLLCTNKDTICFDRERFFEEYGVRPEQFVDVKALMGDSSDCIPGVAGIGEKTALKLIASYGSLDEIYASLEEADITKSVKQKLSDGKDQAYMSQFLARIDRGSPIGKEFGELESKGYDREKLTELFTRLEFSAFIKRFSLEDEDTEEEKAVEYKEISAKELSSLKEGLYGICLYGDGVRICDGEKGYYVKGSELSSSEFFKERELCALDTKRLYKTLAEMGTALSESCFDVSLAAYVLDPSGPSDDLSRLSAAYLGRAFGENGDECLAVRELCPVLMEKLKEDGTEKFYFDAELPLARVLGDMEIRGFKVEKEGLRRFGELLSERENALAEAIYESAGEHFNINSPKQLGEILFEKLGLPVLKKNKTGYSTGAEILEKLMPYHPIIALIFEYRMIAKLKSTYADGLLAVADDEGMIHSTFNQTVTATGRLSSTEPNLQNIPVKTEVGREFRRFFVPEKEGYLLVDADYSQIELRLLAHMSGDEKMIRAFNEGADIHSTTASEVFGVPIEDVSSTLRKRAKAVNFGIVYGIGAYSLSQDIGVTKKEADAYIKSYFEKYPGVKEYIDGTVKKAHEEGYVSTLFGRKRYIPEISSSKAALRSFGERVAMNSPIQGTAADIIKLAMVEVSRRLKESGLDAKLILQVHDELILSASEKDAPAAAELLKECMEGVVSLSVPLTAEVSVAASWYDCK